MFRLAMGHLQAIWTYCFEQTISINEILARYEVYNNCLLKAISLNGLKMTHCESKHVSIWNLCEPTTFNQPAAKRARNSHQKLLV
jgi:hypothetical protein